MKLIVTVLWVVSAAVVFGSGTSQENSPISNCQLACSRIYQPICASNQGIWQLFDNECVMKQKSCEKRQSWVKSELSECLLRRQSAYSQRRLCQIHCPDNYEPVCGFDGTTYKRFGNKCALNAANCNRSEKFREVNSGC